MIDDDETWVSSTAEILDHQRESFVVRTATDIETASSTITEIDPDCVVCDFQLEAATGLDLLADLRDQGDDRPFVLITGQGSESVASEAIGNEVTDYIPKRSLGGRNDLLARRIEQAVESYRTRQALARERRSKDAMLDIVTSTSSREELLQQFCSHLVRERNYDGAWLGTTGRGDGIVPRAVAGIDEYVDAAIEPGTSPESGSEPALVALANAEPHVITDVESATTTAEWRTDAAEAGLASTAAVPLTHDGATVGVLAVYSSTPGFDPESVVLLEEYGETIGYALRSTEWRESLLSPTPVAIEFDLRDESIPLVAVDHVLPDSSKLTVLTTVPRANTLLYVLRAKGITASDIRDSVSGLNAVADWTVTQVEEPPRCEIEVKLPTPETVLSNHGGRIVDVMADHGGVSITVVGQDETEMRTLVDAVTETYPDASVRSVRSAKTVTQQPQRSDPLASLTVKQRRALELSYFNGYFERPREHDTSEVAEKLGVSRQTLTQHLRAGQRKILSALLERANTSTTHYE
ncbi:bacterio-opsin activator domain-containing protein [Halostella salina]|uniref:bacterio-opsin activator domain-containing protein n=1 Tax=Halostella salina TaxID=1547897 RepID=UPI0013CE5B2A|nr:bacterio-opsin activator domain-containing protein [Halostella salina]